MEKLIKKFMQDEHISYEALPDNQDFTIKKLSDDNERLLKLHTAINKKLKAVENERNKYRNELSGIKKALLNLKEKKNREADRKLKEKFNYKYNTKKFECEKLKESLRVVRADRHKANQQIAFLKSRIEKLFGKEGLLKIISSVENPDPEGLEAVRLRLIKREDS